MEGTDQKYEQYQIYAQQASIYALQTQLDQGITYSAEEQQAAYEAFYKYYAEYYYQLEAEQFMSPKSVEPEPEPKIVSQSPQKRIIDSELSSSAQQKVETIAKGALDQISSIKLDSRPVVDPFDSLEILKPSTNPNLSQLSTNLSQLNKNSH